MLGPFHTLEDLRRAAEKLGWVGGYFIRYINFQWFGSRTEMPFNT